MTEPTSKLRIESDGTAHGTRVFVVNEDGSETRLTYVQRVEWGVRVSSGKATATLTVLDVPIAATVDGDRATVTGRPIPTRRAL